MSIAAAAALAALTVVSVGFGAQDLKGGCKSLEPNSGSLVSPTFSLVGESSAQVQFESWWEIEGTNPASHDLMQVEYTIDGGAHWSPIGQMNPANEPQPFGQFFQDYTDNGPNTPATWRPYTMDLSAAAGQPNVTLRFHFDTVDRFYNGFRGWLLDNVTVTGATRPLLSEGFDGVAPGWTTTGFWHQQSQPQTISVTPAINPRLVSLPDGGHLPSAFSGTGVAWYGENSTGTYCGADAVADYVPPPVLGRSFNVTPTAGKVMVKLAGGVFVRLTQERQLPAGAQLDARHGTLRLLAATAASQHIGSTQSASFSGGLVRVTQLTHGASAGLTSLSLVQGSAGRGCEARAAADVVLAHAAKRPPTVLQTLHASDRRGRFRTVGKYSAATVRGTVWDTTDRCDGTLTTVRQGTVVVHDDTRNVDVVVHAGHSYLALAVLPKPCSALGDHDCDGDDAAGR